MKNSIWILIWLWTENQQGDETMEKTILYFAYGSNLDLQQMQMRCPDAVPFTNAVLHGYKLVERTFADIDLSPEDCVNGALYKIRPSDLSVLDCYEGYPEFYERIPVMVSDNAGVYRKALVYTMSRQYKVKCSGQAYSGQYRAICAAGADAWGIPNVFKLQTQETCTLWNNGVPDTAGGLERLLEQTSTQKVLPRAKQLWVGARVVITLKKQYIAGAFDFYPAPLEVTTPHAAELSWIFFDLSAIFRKLLNSSTKLDFYRELADAANRAIAAEPRISAGTLCNKVVKKAKKIYKEMKTV